MGCGRSKPQTQATPAPVTRITDGQIGTGEKILTLSSGSVFTIYEDAFNISFSKSSIENIVNLAINIKSTVALSEAPIPRVTIFKNDTIIYDDVFTLDQYNLYTKQFKFDNTKTLFNIDDTFKVKFDFSIYSKTIEKKITDISTDIITEPFANFNRKTFNMDGYSDENPLLGKIYSPYR
jgi:hypothetical protein